MIVCTTGSTPSPPTAFKLDYWQDKFDRVRNEMRCDKCWLRWPRANQDKNHHCSSNPMLFLYSIFLSLPAYSEAACLWEWECSSLIALRWAHSGHLAFLLPKTFFAHCQLLPSSEGRTPQGRCGTRTQKVSVEQQCNIKIWDVEEKILNPCPL